MTTWPDSAFDATRSLIDTRASLGAGSSNRIRDGAASGHPNKE